MQLASLADGQTQEYEQLLANDELRHPVLASLRLHLQSKPKKLEPEADAPGSVVGEAHDGGHQVFILCACVCSHMVPHAHRS